MPASTPMTLVRALRLLEIERGAPIDEMRQSYRDLVRVWHPDRFESDPRLRAKAAARLAEINEAYRLLQATGTDHPASAPRSAAPSSMPDRRKRPRPAAPSKRRHSWAGYAVAGVVLLAVLSLIGMPSAPARAPEAPVAPRPLVTIAPPAAAAAPPAVTSAVTKPAPPPAVPAQSPFSRDLDRTLARTQSSVR